MSEGDFRPDDTTADCERQIAKLDDPRWPWLMEAVRQGVLANKLQYQAVEHATEITTAIDQDYLSFLQSILRAAELHTSKPAQERQQQVTRPKDDAPNAEDFDLGDQGQSGG